MNDILLIEDAQRLQAKIAPVQETGLLDGFYTMHDLACIEALLGQAHGASRWGAIDLAKMYADKLDESVNKGITRQERDSLVAEHHERICQRFEIKIGSLRTYISIARKWPIAKRLPRLTMAHYQAVDSLPFGAGEEAEAHRHKLLSEAYAQGLTVREMTALAFSTMTPPHSILNGVNEVPQSSNTYIDIAEQFIEQHSVGSLSWDSPGRVVLRSEGNGAALVLVSESPITIEERGK